MKTKDERKTQKTTKEKQQQAARGKEAIAKG